MPSSPQLYTTRLDLYTLSQVTCLIFLCLCICFLPFSLTRWSLLSHAGLLPELLLLEIASSCVQWKTSLMICQLCSTRLSLRAVSQGIPLTSSPKSWKSALLKFSSPTLLLTWSIFNVWSLPSVLMSPVSSFALVGVTPPLWQVCLLPGSGSYPTCIPGVSRLTCSSPCHFSSRCWGAWSPSAGQKPWAQCLL